VIIDEVENPKLFAERNIIIEDKQRNLIPFVMNPIQRKYYRNRTDRDIICKPAQCGMTTMFLVLLFVDTITHPGTNTVILAHEEFLAKRLLDRVQFMYDMIPNDKKPVMKNDAQDIKTFDIHSAMYIGSSKGFHFGRGLAVHNLLCSEIAFYDNPEKSVHPIMQRVVPGGRIIFESTPFGEGFFSAEFKKARRRQSTFKPHFFTWYQQPEYRFPPELGLTQDNHSPLTNLTSDEIELMENKKLNEEQIRWRRYKIAELGEAFFQEFPEDPNTCFLSASETVFDKYKLVSMFDQVKKPISDYNDLKVWCSPERGKEYIIGVDPSGGRHDPAGVTVWTFGGEKFILCGSYEGIIEPFVLAEKIKSWGHYYNDALLVIEANAMGTAVISDCLDYDNLYIRENIITGQQLNQIGWLTNAATKSFMVKEFGKAIAEDAIEIYNKELLNQALSFKYFGGEMKVAEGHDDLLISAMLAIAVQIRPQIKKGRVATYGFSQHWGL
jgi:hypothetical protein